ncbi:glycosyltransferase family protein [Litchfieldia salsa]|uniref:Spore maturation protein CgeB n=1 Tax=Litchfieldia salsa TaxID=930152 RepID=A0A1H0ST39_9BACI|nr:glycosyltransferase [Litchfieldia salsa]SDP44854.1 Spore maturation protein CgeB [Litchfieldia salsa]
MRILFLESSSIWSNNLPRGFQANGHDVMISGPITKSRLKTMIKDFEPELAISIGWGVEQEPMKQLIIREQFSGMDIPLIYWAVEDPAYTDTWSIPLIKRMKPDFVFTLCPKTVDRYEKMGIPSSHLDFGFENSVHHPVEKSSNYQVKIAVVANAYPDKLKEYPDHYRHEAINILLRPLLEDDIQVDFWGNDWEQMKPYLGRNIPKSWLHGPIPYIETQNVYSSADIILGLQNYPEILTQRTYEILGSGGFLLTLDTPGVRSKFQPGKDLDVSSSPKDTIEKISYYLNNAEKRMKIQARGHKAVQSHTYQSRAKQIIETLITRKVIVDKPTKEVGKGFVFHFAHDPHHSVYTVKKGDTLFKISRITGVPVEKIKQINELTSDLIIEGQVLMI